MELFVSLRCFNYLSIYVFLLSVSFSATSPSFLSFSLLSGICFAGNNNVIVSCGMDGHLFRSDLLTDSSFPHRKLRMGCVSWNVQGDVVTAMERPKKKFAGAGNLMSPYKYSSSMH
jgi:hypothetical protein